jgi:hypothetical protein
VAEANRLISGLWTARLWIDFCTFAVGISGFAEAIRKRWSDC